MEKYESLLLIVPVVVLFLVILYLYPIGLWFAATVAGVRISLMELLLMQIRCSPVEEIV